MRILIYILYLGFVFSGELEVEGNLTVTGDINSPTIDALSGMKPERIYRYVGVQYETKGLAVPNNKCWVISGAIPNYSGYVEIQQNGESIGRASVGTSAGFNVIPFIMLSDDIFNLYFTQPAIINIYEYPISGSGTEQGMDYIEP